MEEVVKEAQLAFQIDDILSVDIDVLIDRGIRFILVDKSYSGVVYELVPYVQNGELVRKKVLL